MNNKMKWGIISKSHISNKFTCALKILPEAELFVVESINLEKATEFTAKHNVPRVYASCEDIANNFKCFYWKLHQTGLLELEVAPNVGYLKDIETLGFSFDYPEENVKFMNWLGKGSYLVWKNRIHQTILGCGRRNTIIPLLEKNLKI